MFIGKCSATSVEKFENHHQCPDLTRFDENLDDFEKPELLQQLLQQHGWDAQAVGIVGVGEVGKTTLAK